MAQRIELEAMSAEQIGRLGHAILADVLQSPEAGPEDIARDHVEGAYQKGFTPPHDPRS